MKTKAYFTLILAGIPFFTLSCAGATPAVESTPQPTPNPPASESTPEETVATKEAPSKVEAAEEELKEEEVVSEDRPLFSTFGWKTDFSKHSVPYSEIISGGVGKDGIPPIYQPKFESVPEADVWLTDGDPVAFL